MKQVNRPDVKLNLIKSHYFRQYVHADIKSRDAALKLNQLRGIRQCNGITIEDADLRVIRLSELSSLESKADYEVVCKGSHKSVDASDLDECNFDATPPTGVFVRRSSTGHELDNISHAFLALSEKFGHSGVNEDVFELFGKFVENKRDVLFSDDASQLISTVILRDYTFLTSILQDYTRLQCV